MSFLSASVCVQRFSEDGMPITVRVNQIIERKISNHQNTPPKGHALHSKLSKIPVHSPPGRIVGQAIDRRINNAHLDC